MLLVKDSHDILSVFSLPNVNSSVKDMLIADMKIKPQ